MVAQMSKYEDNMKLLRNEIEHSHEKINILEQEKEDERVDFLKKLDYYEKALTEVRHENTANIQSFMMSVDSKLEEFESHVINNEKKIAKVDSSIERIQIQNKAAIEEQLKSELKKNITPIYQQVNALTKNDQVHQDNIKSIETKLKSSSKSPSPNRNSESVQFVNRGSGALGAGVQQRNSASTVYITETNNNVASKSSKVIDISLTEELNDIHEKIAKLQKIAISHGEVLDDIDAELWKTSKKTTTIIKESNGAPVNIPQTIVDDIDRRLCYVEDHMKDLFAELKFKTEIYNELDEIKIAAASDIKELDVKLRALQSDFALIDRDIK